MSIHTGRLVCPKCKNMNMFFITHEDGFLRCFNSFKCIKNNGNTIWNFSFTIDDKKTEFPEKIIKQKKIVLKVLLIGFAQMRDFKENFLFIVMVVAFLQKTFWISFLNYMKKRISKKIN